MTDIYDRAAQMEELDREIALQAQQGRAGLAGKSVDDSATECSDCDEQIPYLRRAAVPGCQFCVDCQAQREKEFYEH